MSGRIAEVLAASTCRLELSLDPSLRPPNGALPSGPFIVAAAHSSVVDPIPVSAAVHRLGLPFLPLKTRRPGEARVRFLVTDVVWRIPGVSWVVRRAGCIPVARGRAEAAAAFDAARTALAAGDIVVIYPQGDLNHAEDGSPGEFLDGAALLARSVRVPVLPLAHHDARALGSGVGTGAALKGAVSAMVRRPVVDVHAGPMITVDELRRGSVREATALLHERVTACWWEARSRSSARAR